MVPVTQCVDINKYQLLLIMLCIRTILKVGKALEIYDKAQEMIPTKLQEKINIIQKLTDY